MANISGEVTYEWSRENKAKEDPDSEYDDSDYEGAILGNEFSLEDSWKINDDLFIQMYIGFIDHPVTTEEGKMFLKIGLSKKGEVTSVEGPNPEGRFRIIHSSLQVLGADLEDDDFDDFSND